MENQYVAEGWRYHWDSDIEFWKFETGVEKVDNIIKSIMENIPFIDIKPYSHNIISCSLRDLSKLGYNNTLCIDIIRLTPLMDLGWGSIVRNHGELVKNNKKFINRFDLDTRDPRKNK